MIKNKPFIEEIIFKRNEKQDPAREFAVRNKASPINVWGKFQPYNILEFNLIHFTNIDGIKLRFKYTTLTINGRLANK